MPQFYTLEEAARVLGMSPDELKQKAQQREVRAFLDSGSWRFRVADVDELARRRGLGSDPDLSLSDLDLDVPVEGGSDDINLAEFQLGVASPGGSRAGGGSGSREGSDEDVLLDDMSLPPGPASGSSSTIIGMMPAGKRPSDSDVTLVPPTPRGASDSDVRLAAPASGLKPPSDSDVTLVADAAGIHPAAVPPADDPGATTLRPSPLLGSSEEVQAVGTGDSDSDFELTPSSVIDALQPEEGSDFELSALDASDEYQAVPERKPSDSDVTAAEPSTSGINLGRPSDSGINLQALGAGLGLSSDSIELAPLEDDDAAPRPAAKPRPAPEPKADPGATALPVRPKADPGATALPVRPGGEKNIFEDTDFEVDALDTGGDDRTVQLDASSDFDVEDSDSASEVFAIDEEDVDQNAATAMAPAPSARFDADEGEAVSGETPSAWDVESEATPSQVAAAAAAGPVLSTRGAEPEWGGLWVGLLGVAAFLMLLLAFVGMDLVANLYENRGSTNPVSSGLVRQLSGLIGGS